MPRPLLAAPSLRGSLLLASRRPASPLVALSKRHAGHGDGPVPPGQGPWQTWEDADSWDAKNFGKTPKDKYAPLKPMGDWITKPKPGDEPDPQLFGYPELPTEYTQLRDPRAGWWDPQERRNFGEYVQVRDEEYSIWSPEHNPRANPKWALYTLAILGGSLYLTYKYSELAYEYPGFVMREFPYDGNFAAHGFDKEKRDNVYRGIDQRDVFEGSQKEWFEGEEARRKEAGLA